eukprot:CAMPEP_0201481174 /NCGR_PEP_ID=MMETSP0151_2-20130828/5479_1 /ASSEMBLY_ACC=CAM_ASM_000257 /TAXON_ID=200890 /ORGANISM="Paramoeba atlantica, Strain 621/1 / CCAP 1560/9" /LENGTH=509 /DNA_ID=CAMNT_0047863245 /DNA_START=118 /DNA_END=1647 /DNA_ORIENTATION=+
MADVPQKKVIVKDLTLLPDSEGNWPKRVMSKVVKLNKVSDKAHQLFNMPSFDFVVQEYRCRMLSHIGNLRVTSQCLHFHSPLPAQFVESISYRTIKDIQLEKGSKIHLVLEHSEVPFSLLTPGKAPEAFNLIFHLWKFPVSFVRLDLDAPEEDEIGVVQGWGDRTRKLALSDPEPKEKPTKFKKQKMSFSEDQGRRKDYEVNVQGAVEAVRLANQAVEMGEEILKELENQRELLFRLEEQAYEMEHKLDLTRYYLDGIGSLSGAACNLFKLRPKKHPKVMKNEMAAKNQWMEKVKVRKARCLLKLENDMLHPCLLVFEKDKFFAFNEETKNQIGEFSWSYEAVQFIVVRTRPLHLDIHFEEKIPRFRLASSYIQAIVNELYLRCVAKVTPVRVLFEPSARSFDYGSYQLALVESYLEEDSKACAKKVISLADVLENASDETKEQVREVEKCFKEVNVKADELFLIAGEMSEKIEESKDQIENLQEHIAKNTQALNSENKRVHHVIRDLG